MSGPRFYPGQKVYHGATGCVVNGVRYLRIGDRTLIDIRYTEGCFLGCVSTVPAESLRLPDEPLPDHSRRPSGRAA